MIHATSFDELVAIPPEGLDIGDLAVIHVRGPRGEFWADEYRHWTGTEWKYDHHSDPPGPKGDPAPRCQPGEADQPAFVPIPMYLNDDDRRKIKEIIDEAKLREAGDAT